MPISAQPLLEYLQHSSRSAHVEVHPTDIIRLGLEISLLFTLNLHEAFIGFLFCRQL